MATPGGGSWLAERIELLLANTARGYNENGRCWWVRDDAAAEWRLPTLTDAQYARYLASALTAPVEAEAGDADSWPRTTYVDDLTVRAYPSGRVKLRGLPNAAPVEIEPAVVAAIVRVAHRCAATPPAPDGEVEGEGKHLRGLVQRWHAGEILALELAQGVGAVAHRLVDEPPAPAGPQAEGGGA